MGLTTRPSKPALTAVGRSLESSRDTLIAQWANWIASRTSEVPLVDRNTLDRQVALLIDAMIEMTGPLRRQVTELWFDACDGYGRTAAARGLAAGEVVEELQYLRELLIRHLSELIASLPARQSMATVLRLNRHLDRGIAHAVVGYTDVLVEMLLNRRGVLLAASDPGKDDVRERLAHIEQELAVLRRKRESERGRLS